MEPLLLQLPAWLGTLWWPFCRCMAMLSAAPVIGDAMLPVTVRLLLSLVLAVILWPMAQPAAAIDPFSLHGMLETAQQLLVGFVLGLAFHLTMAAVMMLGFLVSSQMGLSMAVMNDPMNGTSSDVVSSLLYMLAILVFFALDGHLVVVGVLGASFGAWPVGGGLATLSLHALPLAVSWVFAAALLLALPLVFSSLVVQIGFGLLSRVAPSLNLYAMGFAVVTLFGLVVLGPLLRHLPEHYLRMSGLVLELINQGLKHGR